MAFTVCDLYVEGGGRVFEERRALDFAIGRWVWRQRSLRTCHSRDDANV
jgi:hypothetical protein